MNYKIPVGDNHVHHQIVNAKHIVHFSFLCLVGHKRDTSEICSELNEAAAITLSRQVGLMLYVDA